MLKNGQKYYKNLVVFTLQNFQSIFAGAQLGGEGGKPPVPFFENKKRPLILGKKCPDCAHP